MVRCRVPNPYAGLQPLARCPEHELGAHAPRGGCGRGVVGEWVQGTQPMRGAPTIRLMAVTQRMGWMRMR